MRTCWWLRLSRLRGAILLYDIENPARLQLIRRYETPNSINGEHSGQVTRVDGRLCEFLSINPRGGERVKLVFVDITDPRAPVDP